MFTSNENNNRKTNRFENLKLNKLNNNNNNADLNEESNFE